MVAGQIARLAHQGREGGNERGVLATRFPLQERCPLHVSEASLPDVFRHGDFVDRVVSCMIGGEE